MGAAELTRQCKAKVINGRHASSGQSAPSDGWACSWVDTLFIGEAGRTDLTRRKAAMDRSTAAEPADKKRCASASFITNL